MAVANFDWKLGNRLMTNRRDHGVARGHLGFYETAPALGAAGAILSVADGGLLSAPSGGGLNPVTAPDHQPDVPRVLAITANVAGLNAGSRHVVITGYDGDGNAVSDTIAVPATATQAVGVVAFAEVTSIQLPNAVHTPAPAPADPVVPQDTISVDTTNALWFPCQLESAALLLLKLFNGSADSGTLALNGSHSEQSTYTPDGTLNGAKLLQFLYVAVNTGPSTS